MGIFEGISDLVNIGGTKKEKNQFDQDVDRSQGVGGRTVFGDNQTEFSKSTQIDKSRDVDYSPTYNIRSPGASGATVTTKKVQTTSTRQAQRQEKPTSIAPALVGGSNQATGESSAEQSGSGLLPILGIGAVGIGAIYFLNQDGGKKK